MVLSPITLTISYQKKINSSIKKLEKYKTEKYFYVTKYTLSLNLRLKNY